MRRMRYAIGAIIALASILVLSCNNSYGIFEDVQGQTKQEGSSIFKKTSAYALFRFGDYYYAKTSRLYRRGVSDSNWDKVSVGGSDSYFLRSAVKCGSYIYALVGDDSADTKLYSSTDGSSWSQITSLPAKTFDQLYAANDVLFAVSNTFVAQESTKSGKDYYSLYYYDGSSFSVVSGFSEITETVRGVVYGGGRYYFASEHNLYSSTDPGNTIASIPSPTTKTIWYISYTGTSGGTGEHLYIGATNGNLYLDGFSGYEDVTSIPLTVVVEVPRSSSSKMLVVGTDTLDSNDTPEGYYEGYYGSLRGGGSDAIVAHSSSIFNSTVANFPVHCFYWDDAAGNLFVCISPGTSSSTYYGLYKSHWDGSSWGGWEAE